MGLCSNTKFLQPPTTPNPSKKTGWRGALWLELACAQWVTNQLCSRLPGVSPQSASRELRPPSTQTLPPPGSRLPLPHPNKPHTCPLRAWEGCTGGHGLSGTARKAAGHPPCCPDLGRAAPEAGPEGQGWRRGPRLLSMDRTPQRRSGGMSWLINHESSHGSCPLLRPDGSRGLITERRTDISMSDPSYHGHHGGRGRLTALCVPSMWHSASGPQAPLPPEQFQGSRAPGHKVSRFPATKLQICLRTMAATWMSASQVPGPQGSPRAPSHGSSQGPGEQVLLGPPPCGGGEGGVEQLNQVTAGQQRGCIVDSEARSLSTVPRPLPTLQTPAWEPRDDEGVPERAS